MTKKCENAENEESELGSVVRQTSRRDVGPRAPRRRDRDYIPASVCITQSRAKLIVRFRRQFRWHQLLFLL
jgi:hypothetical protein